jgi:hypothetical protein
MILQSEGMAQVLDQVPRKFESLTSIPSLPKGEKGFSLSSLNSFQHCFFVGSLFLITFSFSPKPHWNFCNPNVHVIYSVNITQLSCSYSEWIISIALGRGVEPHRAAEREDPQNPSHLLNVRRCGISSRAPALQVQSPEFKSIPPKYV